MRLDFILLINNFLLGLFTQQVNFTLQTVRFFSPLFFNFAVKKWWWFSISVNYNVNDNDSNNNNSNNNNDDDEDDDDDDNNNNDDHNT